MKNRLHHLILLLVLWTVSAGTNVRKKSVGCKKKSVGIILDHKAIVNESTLSINNKERLDIINEVYTSVKRYRNLVNYAEDLHYQTRHNLDIENNEFVAASIHGLTPKEKKVLRYIAIGDKVEEISKIIRDIRIHDKES